MTIIAYSKIFIADRRKAVSEAAVAAKTDKLVINRLKSEAGTNQRISDAFRVLGPIAIVKVEHPSVVGIVLVLRT